MGRKKSTGGGVAASAHASRKTANQQGRGRGRAAKCSSPTGEGEAAGTASGASGSSGAPGRSIMQAIAEPDDMGEVFVAEKKAPQSWDDKVKMLEDFNQLHGHVCVPKHDSELGWWVQQCRQMHNSGKLPQEKRERLEKLGFVWCGQEAKRMREQAEGKTVSSWDDRFRMLMEFREVHGHTCVAMQRHESGLGAWVKEQRSLRNAGKLQEERKQKLLSIGFIFDGAEAKRIREQAQGKPASSWDDKFALLGKFKEQHGHTCVPLQRHDPGLGCWVREQRSLYNSGKLQEPRRLKLESIGFIFDGSEAKRVREQSEGKACHSWNDKFQLLQTFKQTHGHTCVPKQEPELGWWVQQCRQLYNSNKLADDKRQRLQDVGFIFDGAEAKRMRESIQGRAVNNWDEKLLLLQTFKKENGHIDVPQNHAIFAWIKEQRTTHARGKLSHDRRQKLDELGFTWNARQEEKGRDNGAFSLGGPSVESQCTRPSAASGSVAAVPKPKTDLARTSAAVWAQDTAAASADASPMLTEDIDGRHSDVTMTGVATLVFEEEEDDAASHRPPAAAEIGTTQKVSLNFLCASSAQQENEHMPLDGLSTSAHTRQTLGDAQPASVASIGREGSDPAAAGSKRPVTAVDSGVNDSGRNDDIGAGPHKKAAVAPTVGVTGTSVHSNGSLQEVPRGNVTAISEARELLKTSRERCKSLLRVMRTYQEPFFRLCKANYLESEQIQGCIPELEMWRNTLDEYRAAASQILEAVQLIRQERQAWSNINIEGQQKKLELSTASVKLVESALEAAQSHAAVHLHYKNGAKQLATSESQLEAHNHVLERSVCMRACKFPFVCTHGICLRVA